MRFTSLRNRICAAVDLAAEQWIGFAFPPVERAIADANWKPDAPAEYCQHCGDSVGPGEATATGCATCRAGAELSGGIGDGVLRLGTYTESLLEWVRAVKYQRWTEMGTFLGMRLGECIRDAKVIDVNRMIIVPMPMPWPRRLYRGVDHAHVIAEGVSRVLDVPIVRVLRKNTQPPQVTLVPSARRRSGSRGLHIRRRIGGWPLTGLHVLIVDDVRTTGATLKAASRLVKSLKPERTVCAVLAVSDSKARRDRAKRLHANAALQVSPPESAGVQSPA